MSDKPYTKADLLAAIEDIKQASAAKLESLKEMRRLADSLIANPATPPEDIAMIEQMFEQVTAGLAAAKEQEKALADLFFEHDVNELFEEE